MKHTLKNTKKETVEELFTKGILVSQDLLEKELPLKILAKIETEADLIVLNSDYTEIITQEGNLVDWYDLDKYRVAAEKERNDDLYQNQLQQFKKSNLILTNFKKEQDISNLEVVLDTKGKANFSIDPEITSGDLNNIDNFNSLDIQSPTTNSSIDSSVTIVISHQNIPHKYMVNDFTNFFTSRYRYLESLLRNRRELENVLTINRLSGKKEKENVALIGLVDEIGETKNGNIIFTLEDLTGRTKILVSKNNKGLLQSAKDLVVDEVIGISGTSNNEIIFANNIVWPDLPQNNELKKGKKEEYVLFLSDIHVGSTLFLKEEFDRFLKWLRGETGNNQQKEMAKKTKYIFIAGDLVDGVGIYPSQEEELSIKDIKDQYAEIARLLRLIPTDKQIIACPGNHDVVHLAEPQSIFYREFSEELFNIPNLTLVTNPSLINIGKNETFSGFNVLMYHGYSFDYYVANVESIRNNGGYHRADLIMKFLLKRRHLAPSFKSTPYYPSHKEDPLLIKIPPDFFVTGHIHYSSVANYKGVTMICGGCWQGKTTFQEKLGHEPEPARVPIVNLKTREIKVLRFG